MDQRVIEILGAVKQLHFFSVILPDIKLPVGIDKKKPGELPLKSVSPPGILYMT
jgi:hypothetical protein